MTDKLRAAFDRAWRGSEYRSWTRGLLGRPNGDGTYTTLVSDRPGFYFVRIDVSGVLTTTIARAGTGIPARAGLPVRMKLEVGSGYTIYSLDSTSVLDAATAADTVTVSGLPKHNHLLASGQTYLVEAQRMEPGLVRSAGGWNVDVGAFRYKYAGVWQTFAGDTIPMAGSKPTTTGKHLLAVVVLNPATNTLALVLGSEENYATTLDQETIDGISIGDTYPLGAVIVRNDDTSAETQAAYIDARGWLNYADTLTFDDTGTPTAVSDTAADGTSDNPSRDDHVHTYAFDVTVHNPVNVGTTPNLGAADFPARDDHIHGLADNVVTDAKLRNSAALSVIGRSANSSGDPADIATSAASDAVLRESGSTVGFGTVATGGIADAAVSNVKLANMSEKRIKGRAAGAGTGAPADLTPVQVMAIVGGVLYIDNNGDGNIGTGEDTLSTHTIAASTLTNATTMRFEVVGVLAGNSNSKTIRLYFGGSEIMSHTTTNASEYWTIEGRLVAIGDSAQRIWGHYISDTERTYVHTALTKDSSTALDFAVTGEATSDDDIICETVLLTWTAPFV